MSAPERPSSCRRTPARCPAWRRARGAAPWLAGALACLAACSGEEPAAPVALKLTDHATAELLPAPAPPSPAGVPIDTDATKELARPAEAWLTMADVERPLAPLDGRLVVESSGTPGRPHVSLSGRQGALYRLVPARPNTCYAFRAQVRARDLATEDDPFFGATTWIAELTRAGSAEEVLGEDPTRHVVHRELFDTSLGRGGWQDRERLFVTGPETRMLLVALVLAFSEEVRAGAVEFRSVRLEELPRESYWRTRLAWAAGVRALGEESPDGWRAERLVRGTSGAEVRPSIVLFPGDRLRFALDLPEGAPRFACGVAEWTAGLPLPPEATQTFRVRVDGAEARAERVVPAGPSLGRWQPLVHDLSPWAGQRVTLELSLDGPAPGMFGAPVVRDAARVPTERNLVLISIDTLRADHVGCYGAEGDPTPEIDAFARDAVRFAHTVGQSPYTLPGHATLFTGQNPGLHGVQKPGQVLSPVRSPILAELLSARGYRTQAFTGGGFVNAEFGFARGFDGFVGVDPLRPRDAEFFRGLIAQGTRPVRRVAQAAEPGVRMTRALVEENGPERVLAWLEEARDVPFFLFVHTFAIHDYDPPAGTLRCAELGCTSTRTDYRDFMLNQRHGWNPQPISEEDREHLAHLYDATLRDTDARVGQILDRLDALGLAERTVVAITTDHGEEMFERGFVQHGKTLYEELTDLPLLIRVPGVAPGVIDDPAMQVDLLPTLLAALGLPPDPRAQGIDLFGPRPAERPTWSEIRDDFVHKYAYRSPDGWKVVHAPPEEGLVFPAREEWQLFDLESDPGELRNLADLHPERLAELRAALESLRALNRHRARGLGTGAEAQLSEGTLEQIEKLGYTGVR